LSERYDIRQDDQVDAHDTASTETLDRPSYEHGGHVWSRGADDAAYGEKSNRSQKH